MNKINIVTRCNYKSIGSILQAYGLQKQLRNMGYNAVVLVNRKDNQLNMLKINSMKSLIKHIFYKIIIKRIKSAHKKRVNFIDKNINVDYVNDYNDYVQKADEDCNSIYISGSDQVWQPDNCNPIYFLDFVKKQKCISYAASMGKTIIPEHKKEIFEKMIDKFDYISVREEECAEIVRKMTKKNVEVHIDPTFLISRQEWRKMSVKYDVEGPYILLYMLYWDKSCKKKIKEIKRKTGLKVYAISNELSRVYADEVLYDVGIEEFLWLVDNAEYVITSSFHGTAFAAIFNKRFSAIVNPKAPSRIENLMRKLDLPIVDIEELVQTEKFDYCKTNQLIETEKNKSIEYLKKVTE